MNHIFAIIVGVAALGVFAWLFWPDSSPPDSAADSSVDPIIDPSDSRQIGMLIGMMGGSIADAAVARVALERFEQIHKRKATTRDIGVVVGLMRGGF
jgi:hypothetical protein